MPTEKKSSHGNNAFAIQMALLVLRLALGWVFIYAGAGKLFGAFGGMGMENWIKAMEHAPLPVLPPAAWAYMAACGEFFGGLCIFLGLLTRLAAIPLIITMLVAIATQTGKNGFGGYYDATNGLQMGYAYNLVLIAIAIALMLAGAGMISIDAVLFKRGFWSHGPQPLGQSQPPR